MNVLVSLILFKRLVLEFSSCELSVCSPSRLRHWVNILVNATTKENPVSDFKGTTCAYLERTSMHVNKYFYPRFQRLKI